MTGQRDCAIGGCGRGQPRMTIAERPTSKAVSVSTTYFCWFCDAPVVTGAVTDTNYENGRLLYFCTTRHWTEYQDLKDL